MTDAVEFTLALVLSLIAFVLGGAVILFFVILRFAIPLALLTGPITLLVHVL